MFVPSIDAYAECERPVLRRLDLFRVYSEDNQTGWWSQIPRGYRLLALVGSLVLLSVLTITGADSAFSNWGIESNGGWQLINNGHYSTKVYAGGRTDISTGTAYVNGGHKLVLDYRVTVDGGSAFINVYNNLNLSEDALYYESIEQDRTQHVEIPVSHSGLYSIDMSYYDFRGKFDVRWHVD